LSGSWFAGIGRHAPDAPPVLVPLQATQVLLQTESQHTPSTQWPLSQVAPSEHASPSGLLAVQTPPLQYLPLSQSPC
jgi:hypothetical protein